jgi:hypothetical protein
MQTKQQLARLQIPAAMLLQLPPVIVNHRPAAAVAQMVLLVLATAM